LPYPAGGIVDIATRTVTDRLSEIWRQSIIVEAKPGANGNVAWDQVARAEPDGYTWTFVGPAVHPVVISHPETGRPNLYVNSSFTTHFEGWTEKESKPLLEVLYQHAARPEFQTRFRWEEGSIAFWDNRATWHYALNDYQGERRLMHRITIEGVPLKAAH
jgi:alpha-ketoglutarate-dependent taurine dioxygenase